MQSAVAFLLLAMIGAPAAQTEEKKPATEQKVLRLDALKVEGRIQKPQAFYILQRSNLNFGALEQKETFLPNIHRAIFDKPF